MTNIFGKPLSTESTKINNIENVRGFFFALSLFFIFIGDIEFWVGASSFTLPLAFLASGPLVVYASFKAVAKKDIDIIPVLFFGIFLTGLVGTFANSQLAVSRALVAMLPLVVQVLTYITFKNIRYRSIFVDLIFFSGFALAIWIIVLYLSHLNIGGDFQARKLEIETPLGRSNYLAAYLVFIAALASFKRPALLPILVFSIFMTMSRGAFFALAFVFLSRLSFSHSKKSKLFPLSLTLAACVVLIIGLHFSNSYTQTPHGVLQTIYNRFFLWGFSFHELSENFLHFLLGIGPNGFKTAIEQAPGVEQVVDPHNGFLIIWLNYGISGLILYCLFLIFGYRRIRQAVIFDPEMKGILLGIQAMMLYSFYETIIATVAFDMFFVLIVCLSIASYKHHTVSP